MTDGEILGYRRNRKESMILEKTNQCFSIRNSKSLDVKFLLDYFNKTIDFNELKYFVQTDIKKRFTLSTDFCTLKINK